MIVLCAANVACLICLWVLYGAPKSDADPLHAHAASEASTDVVAVPTTPVRQIARDHALERRLRAIIGRYEEEARKLSKGRVDPASVTVGVHVRELGARGEWAAIDAEHALRPASNQKLVTSAAALVLLGSQWNFTTVFTTNAVVDEQGLLAGDLIVHGGGDPFYDPADAGDVAGRLQPAVDALRAAGVRAIDGALVLDEGSFDVPAPGPAWPPSNQHWAEFCALSGAFNLNAGCLTALVRPGGGDGGARVELMPRGHGLRERFDVRTGGARTKLDVRVIARSDAARVEGSIPRDVPRYECRFAAPDPVLVFGNVLAHQLASAGIDIRRGVVRERRVPDARARVIATLRSPLVGVLGPINTDSNNGSADQLFLALGNAVEGRGTREGGRAAVARALERLNVPSDGLVAVDGSGLSRDNRICARQITALLEAVMRLDEGSARIYMDSLAAGGATGTLDRRLKALEGRVRAKTGFIAGTSALSGFLDTDDGRTLVFSILVEYPMMDGLNSNCWKPMQDALCVELAGTRG